MLDHDTAVRRLAAWQELVRQTRLAEDARKDGRVAGVWLSAKQARDIIDHHEDVMRDAYRATDRGDAA